MKSNGRSIKQKKFQLKKRRKEGMRQIYGKRNIKANDKENMSKKNKVV